MKIALPVAKDLLCMHFGHCESFAVFDVDEKEKKIIASVSFGAPTHQPGLLPRWLADKGVKCVIAGGMGSRAITIFKENGIRVITGAPAETPARLIDDYLGGRLATGANVCDH
jgi:ATP-binding protein involved in chromosome partitioning